MQRAATLLLLSFAALLTSCVDPMIEQKISERRMTIANEPRGDWFIGRRYFIDRTQFWGYIRRPGQSWDDSKLVMINESQRKTPDRLPEMPTGDGMARGYDHNREYRMWGHFTGKKIYDPNSDLFLPEFVLTNWEVNNESPGWLFHPKERMDGQHLLRFEKTQYP